MSIGRVTNAAFHCAVVGTLLLATPASAQNRGEVDPAADCALGCFPAAAGRRRA